MDQRCGKAPQKITEYGEGEKGPVNSGLKRGKGKRQARGTMGARGTRGQVAGKDGNPRTAQRPGGQGGGNGMGSNLNRSGVKQAPQRWPWEAAGMGDDGLLRGQRRQYAQLRSAIAGRSRNGECREGPGGGLEISVDGRDRKKSEAGRPREEVAVAT